MKQPMVGIPLQGLKAREIIIALMQEKGIWPRADLIRAVVERHQQEGGVIGKQDPTMVVKKSLTALKEEGRVYSPSLGLWAKMETKTSQGLGDDFPLLNSESSPNDVDDDDLEDIKQSVVKTIGDGKEAVYLYYNPSEKELAGYKNSSVWACKIGMTSVLPVESRIISQGVKTAFSRPPEIALVILTENAYRLEKALHHALFMAGCECSDSLGSEWFQTNPEKVENWFNHFKSAVENLKIN